MLFEELLELNVEDELIIHFMNEKTIEFANKFIGNTFIYAKITEKVVLDNETVIELEVENDELMICLYVTLNDIFKLCVFSAFHDKTEGPYVLDSSIVGDLRFDILINQSEYFLK